MKWYFYRLFAFLGTVFCVAFYAGAYVPSYSMVLSYLAKARGFGAYYVEQEVAFSHLGKSLSLTEKWWFKPPGFLRLEVSFKDFKDQHLYFIYREGKKIFKNEKARLKKQNIPVYHLERPFYLRDREKLAQLFYLWKIAPPYKEEEAVKTKSLLRLVRFFGSVQYEVGKNDSLLWVEQDEFVLRGWKWANKSLFLKASSYKNHPRGFMFPSVRSINWGQVVIKITVKELKSLRLSQNVFHLSHLKSNKWGDFIPLKEKIQEFYHQFR